MPLKKYGVLKGTVLGHLRDADDDNYQILIKAGLTLYRIAVNVLSAAKNALCLLTRWARTMTSKISLKTPSSANFRYRQ